MIGEIKKTTLMLDLQTFSEFEIRKVEVEVLPKETICNIVKDLDFNSLAHEAFDYARDYHSLSGYVLVTLSLIDGEIRTSWISTNTKRIGYCHPYIDLLKIWTDEDDYYNTVEYLEYLLVELEHIHYYHKLEEKYKDTLDEDEIFDMVLEKFNLDKEDLEKEYFKHIDLECLDYYLEEANIEEQIEYFYSKTKK